MKYYGLQPMTALLTMTAEALYHLEQGDKLLVMVY